jgi:hypothetical protein
MATRTLHNELPSIGVVSPSWPYFVRGTANFSALKPSVLLNLSDFFKNTPLPQLGQFSEGMEGLHDGLQMEVKSRKTDIGQ